MKRQATNVQYTVRGIPPEVDRALRRKARASGRSLNQVIIDELTAVTTGKAKKADFSDLTGRWTPDPAVDKILAAQRRIDPDQWK